MYKQKEIDMARKSKKSDKKTGSKFIVDLGNVKLPKKLEQKVAGQIQAAVLQALAEVDYKGDFSTAIPAKEKAEKLFPDWPWPFPFGFWLPR